ncbi:MAG TPA: hypothetical protein V6C86_12685 [Oculatellaceae cyanobacterium]
MVETINMAAVEAPDLIDERLDELYARKRSTLRVKPPSAGNYAFVFLASLVCLAAVYLPLLQYQFGFNDDYFALYERLRNTDWITTMTTQFMLQARPCEALVYIPQVAFLNHIKDFVFVRGLGIVYLAGLATCFYSAFLSVRWSRWQAFAASICLCCVPSFQVILSWITALQFVVPGMLAFGAWHVLRRNPETYVGKILKYCLSFLLMSAAVTIYQPAAMLFWVFVAIGLSDLESPAQERLLFLLDAVTVAAAAYALDFAVFQWAKLHFGTSGLLPGRAGLCTDVIGKAKWFLRNPLVDSLNFFRLQNSLSFAMRSAGFIAFGLLLYIRGNFKYLGASLAVALALIPLSYLPNLLISESLSFYRTQIALMCLVTLYAMLAVKGYLKTFLCRGRAFTLIALSSAVLFGLVAYSNVLDYFAVPQSLELASLRQQAKGDFGPDLAQKPNFLTREDTLAPAICYDEFGMPSSAQEFDHKPLQVLLKLEALEQKNPANAIGDSYSSDTEGGAEDSDEAKSNEDSEQTPAATVKKDGAEDDAADSSAAPRSEKSDAQKATPPAMAGNSTTN